MAVRDLEYGPRAALHWTEIREVTRRARQIMAEHRPAPFDTEHAQRQARLRLLADEYSINLRTLYRYLRLGEAVTVRVGPWTAVFAEGGPRGLPTQIGGWLHDDEAVG